MLAPTVNHWMILAVLAFLFVAVISDVRQRRIPNLLVIVGLGLGLSGHLYLADAAGLVTALAGATVGFFCLLPLYFFNAMGAGDIKLMSACGAFLGPMPVALAAVAALIIGGVIGLVWFFWWWIRSDEMPFRDNDQGGSLLRGRVHGAGPSSIPYSLAIAAGVLVALMAMPQTA